MRSRTFWVLDDEDEAVVDDLAVGLGRTPARVLAYLLLRAEREDDPARTIQLQVGTELSRSPISDAVARLEDDELVERSTVDTDATGRPPSAWTPATDLDTSRRRVYDCHAETLLERAEAIFGRCSDTDSATGDERSGSELAVALNWHPNGLHVPFYAAVETGWYDEYGIEVELDHRAGSRRAVDAVDAGDADVGVAGAATVLRARAAGVPVVPIAVLYQRAMAVLYSTREAFGTELRSVDQLRGRRIGMPARSETGVLGRLFVSQAALGDDLEITATAGEERAALLSGEADVVTGSITDPRQLERQGETVDTLFPTDHFPIYGPTIVARESALRERRSALASFLAGTVGGWIEATDDADRAAERIADRGDDEPDRVRETFERAVEEFGHSDDSRERGWGWQREQTWNRLRTALEQGELLATDP
ncbi:ABC transporter substrate-binding protein [Natronococcus occultus]|uniref:Thiamine pyrimidine synthase n=1 Tax=Natronococcus occultus SP4 TaxID=694430 RepID=L0JWZ2_9EURY|nr:ABC transporter substrate-binding protein [Natronococcus occultus]AGB37567.1 ABC-type nitrate/sulfonate/bicarbonate transport system, periplasmic component [Natronococcus occultus SP4]